MANKKRLIDANALRNALYEADAITMKGVAIINQFPTVDAVEVVRCKDCKHLVLTDEGEHNPNDCVCDYWMSDGLNDFDFCSCGERKDND